MPIQLSLSARNADEPLVVIDPDLFPILSTHWPSIAPNRRHASEVAAEVVERTASHRATDDDEAQAA